MKKSIVGVLLTGVMALSLVACGSSTTTNSQGANANTNEAENVTDTSMKESSSSTEEKKDETIAETTKETEEDSTQLSGKVVVYMPSPKGLNAKYVDGFTAKTGVEVELFEGTTGEILARLEAEKDNPVADVVVLASWSNGLSFKKDNDLISFEPENVDKLHAGWVDDDHTLFGTSASALGVIYNTTLVDSMDADWSDLADEKYKDMLAIPDPQKSGSCKDFLAGYMHATNSDWSAFEGMAKNGLTIPGANKASLEAVVTGEKAILVAGVDYNAYKSIADGEPLAIYYPKSGTVINPRPAMILKSSQNLDNAKAFVEYLLMDEAQQMVADAYLLPGRSDITCSSRSNVSDIPTFDLEWNWMSENSDDIAAKLDALCQ